MGIVYVGTLQVGTFTPDWEGTSGDVYIATSDVGDFTLSYSGYVYIGTEQVGTYTSVTAPLPTFEDARYRTRVYLNVYLDQSALIKDNGAPATYHAMYAYPEYLMEDEFRDATSPKDLLFLVDVPDTTPILYAARYEERVPITIAAVNKENLVATKLIHRARTELQRIARDYFYGSFRTLGPIRPRPERMGSTVIYQLKGILIYRRSHVPSTV